MSHAGGKPVNAFFVRKQAKEHGTKSLIEGLPNGESLKGKRVVIVEDVTTTGGSAIKAAEALRAEGAEVVGVVTVIDREEGAGDAFAAAGLTLTPHPDAGGFQVGRCIDMSASRNQEDSCASGPRSAARSTTPAAEKSIMTASET